MSDWWGLPLLLTIVASSMLAGWKLADSRRPAFDIRSPATPIMVRYTCTDTQWPRVLKCNDKRRNERLYARY